MPILKTEVIAEIELDVRLRESLLTTFKAYQALKIQRDAIDVEMANHKRTLQAVRESQGMDTLEVAGFTVKCVKGTYRKLNKIRLLQLGCALAWLNEAMEVKPKKPYELVLCPGESRVTQEEQE